jgi:glycosyltransferase involved in cell wall biosynthesis
VTAVSRILPHKRFEDVLSFYAELVRIRPEARLVIAGGYDAGSEYFRELQRRARELPGVEFLGKVSHARLVAAYRAASIFVSMSEHEGFGVPLVEAMAADVPVMAYAAAAVPETMDGSGVLFDEKHFAFLAELANELIGPSALRKAVLSAQERRLRSFSAERSLQTLASIFSGRTRSKPKQRGRLAIVVQRYGAVVGGAELLARWIAERLSARWKVTVVTTCARDHLSWANEFPAGESHEGPVRVLRFASERPRDLPSFNALSWQLYARPTELVEEERWLAEQGPQVPGLWRYLDEHQRDFDAFIFFTYLYSSTVWGLPLVARRALLVPTAHDEPPLRFGIYRETFSLPSALLCSTPEERNLIHRRFPGHAKTRLAGVGVDVRPGSASRFRKNFQLSSPYLMYVGRIESGKGLPELLRCYTVLRREFADPPELLLAGSGEMRISEKGVRCLGPISERDKFDGIAGAAAVVVPSRYESLSLLALEAFSQGTPVLANAESEVLVGQIRRSRAGMTYRDPRSFVDAARRVIAQRARLGRRGISYARRHSWKRVLDVYEEELGRIVEESQ